jgi:hypothetical protein
MARYDDLNTKMIAYWAVVSIVILVLILQGTQALCYNMINWTDARRTDPAMDAPTQDKSEQLQSLNGYRKEIVIDDGVKAEDGKEQPKKEVIYIPVEQAQRILMKELVSTNPGGA